MENRTAFYVLCICVWVAGFITGAAVLNVAKTVEDNVPSEQQMINDGVEFRLQEIERRQYTTAQYIDDYNEWVEMTKELIGERNEEE